ncbi:uncharacterized protein Dvir_GJ26165, isoform B [Drosophila virilis]|uniref:Uncharacterized protein, isoform A n=1 Tax=Drosophila virilis TaxID=7244 RepID=A0A0Q9WB48_DROVI|nr:uncharacterized protein Dvir_GJ26165, isoform A [Drosophila virilis]KRF78060.1 uncharacterized protein Dvir_GJ26165, isoform B [Drosophila virilis]
MCSWPCYPAACIGSCGGCAPSGFYDPSYGSMAGPVCGLGGSCCGCWGSCW